MTHMANLLVVLVVCCQTNKSAKKDANSSVCAIFKKI